MWPMSPLKQKIGSGGRIAILLMCKFGRFEIKYQIIQTVVEIKMKYP